MASPRPQFRPKRSLKILVIVIGVLAFAILGVHIWFVNNARDVLKQIVVNKSDGKLKLELSQISFNFLSNNLKVREADLVSTDSVSRPATYHVKFRKLTLRIRSFWPLLWEKKLLLDSIKLHDPEIEMIQWRKDTTSKVTKDELSISQEMGKLYNSMLDVLDGFGIRRIIINNAKVSLINKLKAGSEPVIVSNIYLDLVRTARNAGRRDEFVKNEQSVDLRTTDQDIALPGGTHRLSFKTFNLHLFQKRIELDSCTITAIATGSSRSSYKIFFTKLLLIGVDFNVMYQHNLIRADSVYCENPLFDINLTRSDSVSKKKERPDLEKIVRELTGDLELAFVGVKDAGIHIDISDSRNRSLFNSNKDNFQIRGLRINADSSVPVSVDRFDMLVRDYRLYNEDSSTAYSFDSIHFNNKKIVLNNFAVTTTSTRERVRNERDFRVPYFELTGLDWYQLIFEQSLKAQEAMLYNPVINYIKRTSSGPRKKTNLFAVLQSLDDLVTLNKISVIKGQINMKLGPAISFNLQNANLSLYSNKLMQSTNKEGLRSAIDYFSFSNGLIRLKDITAQLQNVRYTGSTLIHADKLFITSSANKIKASVSDVYLDNMLLDDESEIVVVDGLRWKDATVALHSSPDANTRSSRGSIRLKSVAGNNTRFSFSNGKTSITTFVQSLIVSSLFKNGNGPVQAEGLFVAGDHLFVKNGTMQAKAASYQLASDGPSYLSQVQIERIQQRDSLSIQSPRINFSADVNGILANDIHVTNVHAQSPVIKLNKWNTELAAEDADAQKPSIRIDQMIADEPDINIATHRNDSVTIINIPWSDNSVVKVSGLKVNGQGIQLGSVSATTTHATFVNATGETFGVEKGKVDLSLSNIQLSRKDGKPLWSGLINNLYMQNPNSLAIGKNKDKLLFDQVSVGNVNLSSAYMTDFNQLIKFNVSAWLRTTSGQYIDSTTTLKWYNAEYNSGSRTFSLDSFTYYPTQPRDSVIAHTPHQTDYITFKTGAVHFTDFNLEKYQKDSSLIANTMNIIHPVMAIYRDKLPPRKSGIIRPLPVNMIRNISLPVSVQSVNIIDGMLSYTERNAKSRAEGTLHLTHINGGLANIKNRNLKNDDSLLFTLNGYLMDSALINLRVKQSYTDTLSGFLMTLRMKPTSLSFLNPVLTPLSNVKITSGTIDSFHLRAIGREELALGEMNMYYHNLRIKLVKDGDPDHTTFTRNVASFLANTFVIRKNNNGRTGIIYFERMRDRSFFNYIVKMTFSGMATSVGVKKNRKFRHLYRRELQERKLPPIELE